MNENTPLGDQQQGQQGQPGLQGGPQQPAQQQFPQHSAQQQFPQQQGAPQQPLPGYGNQQPAPKPTNTLSIIAIVASFVAGLVGAILGHISLAKIKRTGEGGKGIAIAAIILGYVNTVVIAILVFAIINSFNTTRDLMKQAEELQQAQKEFEEQEKLNPPPEPAPEPDVPADTGAEIPDPRGPVDTGAEIPDPRGPVDEWKPDFCGPFLQIADQSMAQGLDDPEAERKLYAPLVDIPSPNQFMYQAYQEGGVEIDLYMGAVKLEDMEACLMLNEKMGGALG